MPNTLGGDDISAVIPPLVSELAKDIRVFIVEDLRNARRYLKKLDQSLDIDSLVFHELNKHTRTGELELMLVEVEIGKNAAMISEAGVPGVADPGAQLANLAHKKGIRVVPLTGPSSIILALMASGMNGQQFRFHGYLPVKPPERLKKLKEMDSNVRSTGETQVFIEAPYRNDKLLADILRACSPQSLLCVAADLTMESEWVRTYPVARWLKLSPVLHKRPVIFLLGRV